MPRYSLAESPTGLVHHIQLLDNGDAVTTCGREVNWDTWGRISVMDDFMQGKAPSTIRRALELVTCDRCFT